MPRKKKSESRLQIVIQGSLLLHHRSQNSSHDENSSDLKTDDNHWLQDLENMQKDSIGSSLCTE